MRPPSRVAKVGEIWHLIYPAEEILCRNKGLEDFSIVPAEELGFDTVTFPFLFLVGGIFMGTTFVLCEMLVIKLQRPRDKLPSFQ